MDYRDRYIASLEDQIEMLKTTLQLQAEKLKNLEEKSVFEDKSVSEQIPTPTVPKVQKKREKILKISEVGPACDGCRVRKRRCSRERPSCAYCLKLKKLNPEATGCTYPARTFKPQTTPALTTPALATPARTPPQQVRSDDESKNELITEEEESDE